MRRKSSFSFPKLVLHWRPSTTILCVKFIQAEFLRSLEWLLTYLEHCLSVEETVANCPFLHTPWGWGQLWRLPLRCIGQLSVEEGNEEGA